MWARPRAPPRCSRPCACAAWRSRCRGGGGGCGRSRCWRLHRCRRGCRGGPVWRRRRAAAECPQQVGLAQQLLDRRDPVAAHSRHKVLLPCLPGRTFHGLIGWPGRPQRCCPGGELPLGSGHAPRSNAAFAAATATAAVASLGSTCVGPPITVSHCQPDAASATSLGHWRSTTNTV